MRSVEERLMVLGGLVVAGSGLFWSAPVINSIAAFAGIIALILITARLGYARAFSAAFVGFLLASGAGSLTTGYPEGLYLALVYALAVVAPAIIMGWASRNLYEPGSVVFYGLIPLGVLYLFFAYFYLNLMRDPTFLIETIQADLETFVKANPVLMNLITENYGSGENVLALFQKEFGEFLLETLKIVPGFLMAFMLGVTIFSLAIAGYVALKMGIIISRFRPFHHWSASGWWLLPTIAGLIPVVFRMDELWFYIGLNILIVTGHVYMVVGLAVVEAFLRRALMQTPLKAIFYLILILAGPVSMAFLAILGLLDTKFNFKREIEEFENKE